MVQYINKKSSPPKKKQVLLPSEKAREANCETGFGNEKDLDEQCYENTVLLGMCRQKLEGLECLWSTVYNFRLIIFNIFSSRPFKASSS